MIAKLDMSGEPSFPQSTTGPATVWRYAVHGLLLAAILGLNFFVRCYLDQAGACIPSFMEAYWKDSLPEIYALDWWQYLLPIKGMTGSWCTTSLLLVHGLEHLLGKPAYVFYLTNAIMIATAYLLSWQVFRSWVFTTTLALCLALSTFNHHTYVVSGTVAIPLVVSYLLMFLFCQYKLQEPDCNYMLWIPLGLLSMSVYALGYESWLDSVACMGIAYPFLIAAAYRAGDYRRAKVCGAILLTTVVVAGVYVLMKTRLGHGQGPGSESDVVMNYGAARAIVAVEDVITHFFTLFFITITTYTPPFFFSGSLSSWRYGVAHLQDLQNGYHEDHAYLIGYHHLFLWRFYAGFAAAGFLLLFWKAIRAMWKAPSSLSVGFCVFLLMTLLSGSTHMLVKFRPMHSAPFLGYHSYVGVVGYSMLLALTAHWVYANFQRRWLAWMLVGLLWINLGYCALARPSFLSHMAEQCGFAPYPDAWKNLKSIVRR